MSTRLMPDPIPPSGGMLTAEELAACKRVLHRFEHRTQTLAVMEMPEIEQRAYVACWRMGYLLEHPTPSRTIFRWTEAEISEAGRMWLTQVS